MSECLKLHPQLVRSAAPSGFEDRIAALLTELAAPYADEITTDAVSVGSVVRVFDEDFEEEIEYTILGATESDPLNNIISDQSPTGRALIGAKVGDEVTVEAPGGEIKLKVLEISKQNN